ncbi:GRAM and VASt domain-containing protein [Rhodotorula paludigena]|uniref:GRAM and VASt domain-containing protein n=1 Tax=Rhodotorula paludigena TaxID=86838 RepID=UPI003176028A
MLSRLKRRAPSASFPDPRPDSLPDDTDLAPQPASPQASTKSSTRSYTTPVKGSLRDRDRDHPDRTLSPTRALSSGRQSRSSSFGSYTSDRRSLTLVSPTELGARNQAGEPGVRVDDIGSGSLSLDHLAPAVPNPNSAQSNLTLVVQAPELLVESASSAGGDSSVENDDLKTPTDWHADDRTPLASHEPHFASSSAGLHPHRSGTAPANGAFVAAHGGGGRPRSHTSSEAMLGRVRTPVAYDESGLDALAAINVSPARGAAIRAASRNGRRSATASPPSMSRTSSRGAGGAGGGMPSTSSRHESRSSSINSQQYPEGLSLRPPAAAAAGSGTSARSASPARGRAASGKNGIAGALALSGVALASPSSSLRHPHALAPLSPGADGERTPVSPSGSAKQQQQGVVHGSQGSSTASLAPQLPPTTTSARSSLESHISPAASSGYFAGAEADGGGGGMSDEQLSLYGGVDAATGFLSMDQLGDFDDVVSQLGTGYAVASSKRNAEFHALFRNIPDDDYLIEDYGCALQREILIQGRLYISEHHLSFYANIFGWVTSLTLPFSEVCSIEKRMTAYVIPNAIQIATIHARHTFASFLSRDTTYDLIGNIWRMVHPVVPMSAALPDALTTTTSRDLESDDEGIVSASGVEAAAPSEGIHTRAKRRLKGFRRPRGGTGESSVGGGAKAASSVDGGEAGAAGEDGVADGGAGGDAAAGEGATKGKKAAKAAPHPPTVDTCATLKNLKEVCMDSTFPGAPEKLYNLMFTSGFMKGFWAENQKLTEIQIGDWAPQASGSNLLARSMSYIKPLNGSIGPKQTKCLITDESAHVDFDDFVCVITTTRTPDVPSGSAFAVKTRTSMTWARGNSCRVVVTTGVEWTKSSFIKGIIEKSAIDGQKQYHADLEKAMRAYIATHRNEFAHEGVDPDDAGSDLDDLDGAAATAAATAEDGVDASVAAELADEAVRRQQQRLGGGLLAPVWTALEPVFETLAHQSPQSILLGAVVAILVLSNVWTLWSSSAEVGRRSDVHPAERARRRAAAAGEGAYGAPSTAHDEVERDRTPHDVASAVRDVLHDYFAAQHGGGAAASPKTAEPVAEPPAHGDVAVPTVDELRELEAWLDRIEARVESLRAGLRGAVGTEA